MAFYDFFEGPGRERLALAMDEAIKEVMRAGWKSNPQSQQNIKRAIYDTLVADRWPEEVAKEEVENVFVIVKNQDDYDI